MRRGKEEGCGMRGVEEWEGIWGGRRVREDGGGSGKWKGGCGVRKVIEEG